MRGLTLFEKNKIIIINCKNILFRPIMILPTLNECTIAVRCCPVYFKLREDGPVSMITLPYRMVFAVATHHSVLIYDTQQTSPLAIISNIHYGRLNDVSWYVLYVSHVFLSIYACCYIEFRLFKLFGLNFSFLVSLLQV